METSMNRRSHFLPVILLAVISLMALLFTGCGSESSSRESKSEPNPYAEFKDLYKTDPLNRKYAYYYTNEKLGNIFTKERKELADFDPAKYNKVNIAWHSVDGHKFWQITRKDSLNYYRGPIKNNKPDGIGVIYWKDHPYYIAHFKDGSMEGYGQEIREGSFSLPNYSKYSVPGRMPLHGLFQFEKTDIFKVSPAVYRGYYMSYEGYYKNNERNGEGISYNYENIKYLLQLAEANARTKFISNEAERKKHELEDSTGQQIKEYNRLLDDYHKQVIDYIHEYQAQHKDSRVEVPTSAEMEHMHYLYDLGGLDKLCNMNKEVKEHLLDLQEEFYKKAASTYMVPTAIPEFEEQVETAFSLIPFTYENFEKDTLNGHGTDYGPYGVIFDGEYKDNRYLKGKEYNANNILTYDGEFNKKGHYEGKGTQYDENGNVVYSGNWKDGDYAVN